MADTPYVQWGESDFTLFSERKLNCGPDTYQCGGRCIPKSQKCRQEEKKAYAEKLKAKLDTAKKAAPKTKDTDLPDKADDLYKLFDNKLAPQTIRLAGELENAVDWKTESWKKPDVKEAFDAGWKAGYEGADDDNAIVAYRKKSGLHAYAYHEGLRTGEQEV